MRLAYVVAALLVAGGLLLAPEARAESALSFQDATKLVESTDRGKVRVALAALRASKRPQATRPIAKRIEAGLPPDLLDEAMDALAALPRGYGSSVLLDLTRHRSAKVRARAIRISAMQKVPGAPRALVSALDDGDAAVRGAAVEGLVELQARAAVPSLFEAFDREVPEAAEALGALAGAGHVPRILGFLDSHPFGRVLPALGALLGRSDLPVGVRVRILDRLGEASVAEVTLFLRGFAAGLPPGERDPIRRAALAALDAHDAARAAPEGGGGEGGAAEGAAEEGGTP